MRDLLTDALDANLARLSVRQNDDMRRMSAWAALFLLPTVLVGVWGMNFEHMPELEQPWGYPAALGVLIGSCALLYWRLRRSGWL
jgi:magnesium transporter